jgi:hypothetical protein
MRSFVVLTSLCFALFGCGGNGAPQTFTIRAGETVTYEAGVVREGDKILCVRGGERLGGAVVPKPGMGVAGAGVGIGPEGGGSFNVAARDDGSVVASCAG